MLDMAGPALNPYVKFTVTEDFSDGYKHKRDVTQLKPGTLIIGSKNVVITDGDRVGPRRGSLRFLEAPTTTEPRKALHTFKKRNGENVLMGAYGEYLQFHNKITDTMETILSGLDNANFGFVDHNVNDDDREFTYFCNAFDPYARWNGNYSVLDGALTLGATEIAVAEPTTGETFHRNLASASTSTSITIANAEWSADLWNGFWVKITSGAFSGKYGYISATTSTALTISSITGLTGTFSFEIVQMKFPLTGTTAVVIGGTLVQYSTINEDGHLTGAVGTPAAADGASIAAAPQLFPANPRGNVLFGLNTRVFVANIKGKQSSMAYSAIADATDFTFSTPRTADQGGVIDMPEGGGGIIGADIQEETIYALKEDIIKTVTFTTDENDFPVIKPLISAPQVGSGSRLGVFKVDNQVYFTTIEGGVKSVTRVPMIDYVQPLQLSDSIVELVKRLDFTNAAGIFYRQKAYIACASEDGAANDIVLPFNFQKNAWEAPIYGWPAASWTIYEKKLYFGSSVNEGIVQVDVPDRYDDSDEPYEAIARFAYNNFGDPAHPKTFDTVFMEGYLSENTTIEIVARYNYVGSQGVRVGSLTGTESKYLVGGIDYNVLGEEALGSEPLAGSIEEDDTPNPLRKFRIYFETKADDLYELSIEVRSNAAGSQWELLRYGPNAKIENSIMKKLTKALGELLA